LNRQAEIVVEPKVCYRKSDEIETFFSAGNRRFSASTYLQ